jgi:DNA-binding response OmpR family regulator
MGTILVVDDHLPTAKAVAALLRLSGHRAVCAGGGNEALHYLADNRPDLMILDVMMPGMDGFAVLDRLRSDRRFASLPVLMYSAMDDAEPRAKALKAGAQDYLVKGSGSWDRVEAAIDLHLRPADAPGRTPAGDR